MKKISLSYSNNYFLMNLSDFKINNKILIKKQNDT